MFRYPHRRHACFLYYSIILQILNELLQGVHFLVIEGDALAHAGMVRRPFADVILRFALVPGDHVELFGPAAGILSENADFFGDLIFKFRFRHKINYSFK